MSALAFKPFAYWINATGRIQNYFGVKYVGSVIVAFKATVPTSIGHTVQFLTFLCLLLIRMTANAKKFPWAEKN